MEKSALVRERERERETDKLNGEERWRRKERERDIDEICGVEKGKGVYK